MLSKRIIPAAIVAAAALSVAPAAGAITWSAPVTVSAAGEHAYLTPRVASDANGDMVAAWLQETSDTPGANCPCKVRAAYRPAGGSFGAPVDVSPSMPINDSAQQILLAMSGNGEAIVAWNGGQDPVNSANYDTAYASIRSAGVGGTWGVPVVLDAATAQNGLGTSIDNLVMDNAGDAIAGLNAYQPYTGLGGTPGDQVIDAEVVHRSAGGAFDSQHPQVLTDGQHVGYPRALAMSPNGKAVMALREDSVDENDPTTPQPNSVLTMTSAAPGAAFGNSHTLETVTPTTIGGFPSVDTGDDSRNDAAIDDAGDYAVEYDRNDPNGQPFSFNATVKVSFNGGAPLSISPSGAVSAAANGVLMDSTGQAVALLDETDPSTAEFESVRPAGGSFGAATALSSTLPPPGAVANVSNAEGANGQIVYAFDGAGANSSDDLASIGSASGVFAAPTTLATNEDNFSLGVSAAIDNSGDAAVVWRGAPDGTAVRVSVGSNGSNPPPPTTHTLTVSKPGSGSGTVTSSPAGISCGSACSHPFNAGTAVTLTATAAAGSTFAGWSGGGCSGAGVCKVTLSGDATVTATFNAGSGQQGVPDTKITSRKINKKKHTAKFAFKAVGTATGFKCALVKAPKKGHKAAKARFAGCKSPKTYKHLKHGKYTFEVRAVNAAGTDPTPAKAKFKV
jgi:hypothetical protein